MRIFKQLRYPFMMSSTFLRSINAPGTWPTVLAALHWFVHIVAAAHTVDCTLLCAGTEPGRIHIRPSKSRKQQQHSSEFKMPRYAALFKEQIYSAPVRREI